MPLRTRKKVLIVLANEKVDYSVANPDVVNKYKAAGDISNRVLQQVRAICKDGSQIFDITAKGDELMNEELSKVYSSKKTSKVSKGIAFPTCVNPNQIPAHLAPTGKDDEANLTLANGDVVNVMLGVQIDGFPSVVAETFVIGESKETPVSGKKADLLYAAWKASEAAIRTFVPGNRNWDVTNVIDQVTKEYECTGVENMLTHNQERNVLYGPKQIIINPSKENKSQIDTVKFEENEVYGLDVLVTTSPDGKVRQSNYRTTMYKLTGNSYALKLKLSHQILGEFKAKSPGPFPVNIKNMDDIRKARLGVIECVNHQILLPYDIMIGKEGEPIAQFFTTFAVTKNGILKFTSPSFESDLYKSDKNIKDEKLTNLISQPLKAAAKKKKDNKKQAEGNTPASA